MKPTAPEIQVDVFTLVTKMIADWDLDLGDLGPATRFNEDLCASSVDMLNLMASIDMKYKRKLPYDKLILKDGHYVKDLSIGELSQFVIDHYDTPVPEPRPM